MRMLLILNLVFEGVIGIFLVIAPGQLGAGDNPVALVWMRNYGFAAIAMAGLGAFVWQEIDNLAALSVGLGGLSLFHVGLAVSSVLNANIDPATNIPVAIVHGAFGVVFISYYVKYYNQIRQPQ